MATPQENLARFQMIADRGLQDRLDPDKRARFDMAVSRGLVTAGNQEPSTFDSVVGVADTALSIASGIPAELGRGLSFLGTAALTGGDIDAATAVSEDVGATLTYNPRSEEGQKNLQAIGGSELLQTVSNAMSTVETALGDAGFDLAGPIGGAIGETLPTLIVEAIPGLAALRGVRPAARQAKAAGQQVARAVETAAPVAREVAGELVETGRDLINVQGAKKGAIAEKLSARPISDEAGVFDPKVSNETAGFQLTEDFEPTSKLGKALKIGGKRVETDRPAKAAVGQGIERGLVAAMVGSSAIDKTLMAKMLRIVKRGKENLRFQDEFRASDVVGQVVLDNYKAVKAANKSAGKNIDRISKGKEMSTQPVDIADSVHDFGRGMEEMGIELKDSDGVFTLNFERSQLPPGDRGPLNEVVRIMNLAGRGEITGLTAHKMKRAIDNHVTFGKNETGLSGDGERLLKKFRIGIDKALDNKFPEYDKANIQYAETIKGIDDLQDTAGRKLDFEGPNAEKQLGTVMGRILSNAQSRIPIKNSVIALEKLKTKYSGAPLRIGKDPGTLDSDFQTLLMFADRLEGIFDVAPTKSLQGQVKKGTVNAIGEVVEASVSPVTAGLKVAAKGVDVVRRRTDAKKFKAMEDILRGRK